MSTLLIFSPSEHEKAQDFAKAKFLRALYADKLHTQLKAINLSGTSKQAGTDPETFKLIKEDFDRKELKLKQLKSTHVLITVNPQEDEIELLIKKVRKCISKSWVKGSIYCIEQRSSEQSIPSYGYHAHILIPRADKSPSQIAREVRSTFKALCGTDRAIDLQWCDPKHAYNAYCYILGQKISPDKQAKVERDRSWRLSHDIDDYYLTGDLGLQVPT